MHAWFCDFLDHRQWFLMIFIPNDKSSLDLHFGILLVIFLCAWCDPWCLLLVGVQCLCTVPVSIWIVFSCDPFSKSLYFLSQIVDHLEIFVWICDLCCLVDRAWTSSHSHFRWFSRSSSLLFCIWQDWYAVLFRHADFALESPLNLDFGIRNHCGMPMVLLSVSSRH